MSTLDVTTGSAAYILTAITGQPNSGDVRIANLEAALRDAIVVMSSRGLYLAADRAKAVLERAGEGAEAADNG
jgi:hypothetical protein